VDFLAPIVAPASAQTLARLHVRTFTMTAEPKSLHVGESLRLRIVAHVDENVGQLDNVTLPDLAGFDSLGDERVCASVGRGTDCTEVLALSPTEPGDRTIGPTTLDAIDARNGKPSHFATNSVTIHVIGAGPQPSNVTRALVDNLLRPLMILGFVGAAAYALLWGFGRRRSREPATPNHVTLSEVSAANEVEAPTKLADLIAALERDRSRKNILAVRDELRRRVGAREEETLGDLLRRRAAGDDAALVGALRAVERASFVDDSRLPSAIDDALRALSNWKRA
jgi:hypothetical protein